MFLQFALRKKRGKRETAKPRFLVLRRRTLTVGAALLAALAETADGFYARAFKQMKKFPRLKMLPCRVMGYVYVKNLAKIRATDFHFIRPVKLTKGEKLKSIGYALLKTIF